MVFTRNTDKAWATHATGQGRLVWRVTRSKPMKIFLGPNFFILIIFQLKRVGRRLDLSPAWNWCPTLPIRCYWVLKFGLKNPCLNFWRDKVCKILSSTVLLYISHSGSATIGFYLLEEVSFIAELFPWYVFVSWTPKPTLNSKKTSYPLNSRNI